MSKTYSINIAAQVAQDAANKPYPDYSIPEPESFKAYREGLEKLKLVPRSEFGTNPDIQAPEKYKSVTLKRGGEPVQLTVCEELLTLLKSDKKNLLIFGITEIVQDKPQKQARAG
jgi:hypothetical protein